MPEVTDFTSNGTVLVLLTQAHDLAERRVLDEPLDLKAVDVALGVALLRGHALQLRWEAGVAAPPDPGLGLVESLEHAERLSRDIPCVGLNPSQSSAFVAALCDLIREARSLA